MSSAKIYFPTVPLQEMIKRPGGIARDQALAAATANVQAEGGEGNRNIEEAIQAIEEIVATPENGRLSSDQLGVILSQADRIVSLAGTFGYEGLDRATRSLCDIADGLVNSNRGDLAPVAVHIRAMRLIFTHFRTQTSDECGRILGELSKVIVHYECAPLGPSKAP